MKPITIGSIILLVLSGLVIIYFNIGGVRIDVSNSDTRIYINQSGDFVLGGIEQISLGDDVCKKDYIFYHENITANKSKYNVSFNNCTLVTYIPYKITISKSIKNINSTITRTYYYNISNKTVTEVTKYMFDGSIKEKELFPISETHKITGGKGLKFIYNVSIFSDNVKVTLNDNITLSISSIIIYDIIKSPQTFNIRLFDPQWTVIYNTTLNKTYDYRLKINQSLMTEVILFYVNGSNGVNLNGTKLFIQASSTTGNLSLYYNNVTDYAIVENDTNIQNNVFPTNLVSYYKSDEQSGNLIDAKGYYNFTQVNSPTSTAGVINNSRYTDISGQKYFHRDNAFLNFNSGNFTINFWVKKTATQNAAHIITSSFTTGYNNQGMSIYWDSTTSDKIRFYGIGTDTTGYSVYSSTTLQNNVWYMVTGVKNSTHLTLYINGVFNATATYTQTGNWWSATEASVGDIYLSGSPSLGNIATNYIDEISIYNSYLTSSQIKSLFNNTNNTKGYGDVYEYSNNIISNNFITFINQNPVNITQTNLFGNRLLIQYNITVPNLNSSTVFMNYTTNNSMSCIIFSNGTCIRSGYVTSNVNITNVSSIFNFTSGENEIYPCTQNFPDSVLGTANYTNTLLLNGNNAILTKLRNITLVNNHVLELYLNSSITVGSCRIYICNKSYNPDSGLSFSTSANCFNFASQSGSSMNHTDGTSKHNLFPWSINTTSNKTGTVKITNDYVYFIVRGPLVGTCYLGNFSGVSNVGDTRTTTNLGTSWINNSFSIDIQDNYWNNSYTFQYEVCGSNSTERFCSNVTEGISLIPFPPTIPTIIIPNETSYPINTTINITWTPSMPSGLASISFYNVSLLNSDASFNKTLNTSTTLNYFYWNTTGTNSGTYYVFVKVTDSNNMTANDTSISFSLLGPASPNVTMITNNTYLELGSSINITANTTSGIVCIDIYPYNNGININCGSNNVDYLFNVNKFNNNIFIDGNTSKNYTFLNIGFCKQKNSNADYGCNIEKLQDYYFTNNYIYVNRTYSNQTILNSSFYEVHHGTINTYNISLSNISFCKYNNAFYFRFYSNNACGGLGTSLECNNGTDWIYIGQNSSNGGSCGGGVSDGGSSNFYYENYYSGVFWTGVWSSCGFVYSCYTSPRIASVLFEESMYLYNYTNISITNLMNSNITNSMQFDYRDTILNGSLLLKGFSLDGITNPTNVKLYIGNITVASISSLSSGNIILTSFNDSTTSKNYNFTSESLVTLGYLKIPKNSNITSVSLNITGIISTNISKSNIDSYGISRDNNTYAIINGACYTDSFVCDSDFSINYPVKFNDGDYSSYVFIINNSFPVTGYIYINHSSQLSFNERLRFKVRVKNNTIEKITDSFVEIPESCKKQNGVTQIKISLTAGKLNTNFNNATILCYNGTTFLTLFNDLVWTTSGSVSSQVNFYEQTLYYDSYPNNPYLKMGTLDGTKDWNVTGFFNFTSGTNSFNTSIQSYLASCTADSLGYCQVPMNIYSLGLGLINVSNIAVTYVKSNAFPVTLNATIIQNYIYTHNGTLNLTIESNQGSIIEISNISIDYLGGNKTYLVTAHTPDYASNQSINITFFYSGWNYSFPKNINYFEFIPSTPNSKNVTPYGQTIQRPILNITNLGYGGLNINFSIYQNESLPCVNTTISTSYNKSKGIRLSTGWNEIFINSSYLQSNALWMWSDYSCNYSTWKIWQPDWSFRACCVSCICSNSTS